MGDTKTLLKNKFEFSFLFYEEDKEYLEIEKIVENSFGYISKSIKFIFIIIILVLFFLYSLNCLINSNLRIEDDLITIIQCNYENIIEDIALKFEKRKIIIKEDEKEKVIEISKTNFNKYKIKPVIKTFLIPTETEEVVSAFGYRKHPIYGERRFHTGVDYRAKLNSKIKATKNGKIIYAGWKGGYGKVIILEHENGYRTYYAHLNKFIKHLNENVTAGDIIALSGATGNVTGAHLHYEIRKNGKPLNPLSLI